jgi:hypothetical protein
VRPEDWVPNSELPEGSIPVAALLIVNYIGPDGRNQRLVSVKGHCPATTYLGMTVKAQADINAWDEEACDD